MQRTLNNFLLERFQAPRIDQPHPIVNEEFVQEMFQDNTRRMNHIIGVARKVPALFKIIALLHDVGYASAVHKYTEFHPVDGAIYAAQLGFSENVVKAILFHSGASGEREDLNKFYNEALNLYRDEVYFRVPSTDGTELSISSIDVITYYDTHTSPDGVWLTLDNRLNEIYARYGQEHPVSANMKNHERYFRKLDQLDWDRFAKFADQFFL